MDTLVFLAIVTIAVFVGVFTLGRSDVFTIRLSPSGARKHRGTPPRGFVDDCAEIARARKIKAGEIRGVRKRGQVKLQFSSDIAGHQHQPFHNAFALRRRKR